MTGFLSYFEQKKGKSMGRLLGGCAVAALLSASNAIAAPCAGFLDVDAASPFCANVEWLKNRSITLGCSSSTLYCPTDPVSRLAMAAFMNRLGNAVEPQFRHTILTGAQAAVNAGTTICVTPSYAVDNFPRVATATAMFFHRAAASEDVFAQAMYSVDAGATWLTFGDILSVAGNVAGKYASQSPVAKPLILSPGTVIQFGISTGVLSSGPVSDAACELTVRFDSHTGTSSPYDADGLTAAQVGLPNRR